MVGLFTATLFTSALLLFWVQPMVAKMLLPLLGGTPTVWNTCVVFFQAILLAGYGYAHWLTTRISLRSQTLVHLGLMLATLAVLPFGFDYQTTQAAPWNSDPFAWLLQRLFTLVALPFFVVSTSAPLLQSWFSRTGHRSARDPYFLYAASNLGSMAGLLGYVAWIEPRFRLSDQTRLWAGVYGALAVLFVGCALVSWRNAPSKVDSPARERSDASPPVIWPRRLRWIFWAFVPSSLMLGLTSYLTMDIASVPLLWVVPLGIYLLTFILVFSRKQILRLAWLDRLLPLAAVALAFIMLAGADNVVTVQILIHLVFFFLAAMVCHARLANDRPGSRRLTEFYFCLSLGGVLGGLFNALLAPVLFRTVVEYPLMIVLACASVSGQESISLKSPRFWRGLGLAVGLGYLTAALAIVVPGFISQPQLRVVSVFGLPLILCYLLGRKSGSFALALGAVLLGSTYYTVVSGRTLHRERNFFGALRVARDSEHRTYRLYHGTTIHGIQFRAPDRQCEPLAYYHRAGPCGQAMQAFNDRPGGATNIAVIGLGAGSMVGYAQPGQSWTFYEINPLVIRLAQDTNYFTYLQRCANAPVKLQLGDARLRLRTVPAGEIDVLVCDAFGSDAPPLHLITREAMEMYLAKLSPNGVLLFHLSSQYLDFQPVVGNLAAHFQLQALGTLDADFTEATLREGKLASFWVAMARGPADLGALAGDPRWRPIAPDPAMRLWTDDYSNILGIFEWQ